MRKRIKKVFNGLVALSVAQVPIYFPNEIIMLAAFIIGMISIAVITYCLMELINH